MAEPLCRPPSLTLSVHGARERPAPRAQVSLLWALPCPLPGVSDSLGGADALPYPSSPAAVTVADLVKPSESCGNNTGCCSGAGVAPARGGGGDAPGALHLSTAGRARGVVRNSPPSAGWCRVRHCCRAWPGPQSGAAHTEGTEPRAHRQATHAALLPNTEPCQNAGHLRTVTGPRCSLWTL